MSGEDRREEETSETSITLEALRGAPGESRVREGSDGSEPCGTPALDREDDGATEARAPGA